MYPLKKLLLVLVSICLLVAGIPLSSRAMPNETLTTAANGDYLFYYPDGWLYCSGDNVKDGLDLLTSNSSYLLLNTFLFGNGVHEGTSYLFKKDGTAILTIYTTMLEAAVTDEDLLNLTAQQISSFQYYENFYTDTSENGAALLDLDSWGIRWLIRSCQFNDGDVQWFSISIVGAREKQAIHLNLLSPTAQGDEDSSSLVSVLQSFVPKLDPFSEGSPETSDYSMIEIDTAKKAYYHNGHTAYVDKEAHTLYAIPEGWIGLFDYNRSDELDAVEKAGKPYSPALAALSDSLYDMYSATILTDDLLGVLVSASDDRDDSVAWREEVLDRIAYFDNAILGLNGFDSMVSQPGDAADPGKLNMLVYEYRQNIAEEPWRVLAGFVPYGKQLVSIFLYRHEGDMTDALRAEFQNTLLSVQAGILLDQ